VAIGYYFSIAGVYLRPMVELLVYLIKLSFCIGSIEKLNLAFDIHRPKQKGAGPGRAAPSCCGFDYQMRLSLTSMLPRVAFE
jgi:hypothetical protein